MSFRAVEDVKLGCSWMPSMSMNQDIETYCHTDALAFQRELLAEISIKKMKS